MGELKISYIILCESDVQIEIGTEQLLAEESIARAIKNSFAKGKRNIELESTTSGKLLIKTEKEVHALTIPKDDFADAITLAEEDAAKRKLMKKGCSGVKLIDIESIPVHVENSADQTKAGRKNMNEATGKQEQKG